MKPKIKKVGNKYYVDTGIRTGYKRYRKTFNSQKEADNFCRKFAADNPIGPEPPAKDIGTAIRQYIVWSRDIKGKSPNTMRTDESRLMIFDRWIIANNIRHLADITSNHMRQFQEYYFANAPFANKPNQRPSANAATPNTWEKYRQIISAFFHWAKKRGLIKENPISDPEFKIKVQQKVPVIFSKEEIGRLLAAFDARGMKTPTKFPGLPTKPPGSPPDSSPFFIPLPPGIIFRILLYTGMRLGELINLKWIDVDLAAGIIQITKSKSKKIRSIPIHAELLQRLESLPTRGNIYVLDSGNNTPAYSDSWYWKELQAACVNADIKPRPVHTFRHTFAANLAMAGVDIGTIKELLGHSDFATTSIYIHFTSQHNKKAIETISFE